MSTIPSTLRTLSTSLAYEPTPLRFGTSGRRGLVADLTQLEVYLNALAELEYLQSRPTSEGGITERDEFYFACDLRPSSTGVVGDDPPRGGLAQAILQAIRDSGMTPVYLGLIPTPALANFAFTRAKGSMMITGSHIPFDRNGYKTNTAVGELLKKDEAPIQKRVQQIRERLYEQPAAESPFDANGMLKDQPVLPPARPDAATAFLDRYTRFFPENGLQGLRLLVYQHSAVGRDLLVDLLRRFGAEVIPAGRSETFVPIDTEAIGAEQLETIQSLAVEAWKEHGPIDAVVSTDGDSDRPLILGVEPAAERSSDPPCTVRFFGGDLVGMVVAEYLKADAVVVPISCNDALDRGPLKDVVEPKTRIGSPYVIAGMQKAREAGRQVVCGWEANGGFLLGSTIERDGRQLRELPTRDAFLPILAVLLRAKSEGCKVSALFDRLPRRFSRAALLRNFPRPTSLKIVAMFSAPEPTLTEVQFDNGSVTGRDASERDIPLSEDDVTKMQAIRDELQSHFTEPLGFGPLVKLNYTDGVRMYFANGDVAHVRPSGNADELRIYAVADSQERADAITQAGVAEPDGILRKLEKAVSDSTDQADHG